MTLHLRNFQKTIFFSVRQFERDINVLRIAAGIRKHDLGILCTDTNYITQLQRDIKQLAAENDGVLVFPFNEKSLYWTPGQMPAPKVEYNLGDIVLDMPKIYELSKAEYLNLYSMMTVMTTRGLSQLLGNRHGEDIYKKDLEILDKYNQLTGADLHPFLKPQTPELESAV